MDVMDVLTQAMKLETDGRDFYNKIASSLDDNDAASMFSQLADDEVDHYKYIQRQFDALQEGKGWSEIPELDAIEEIDAVSIVFPEGKQALKVLPPNPTEEDALLFALGIEDKSFKLYHNSSKQVADTAAQQMFLQLAGAEKKHFEVIMQRYESRFGYPR